MPFGPFNAWCGLQGPLVLNAAPHPMPSLLSACVQPVLCASGLTERMIQRRKGAGAAQGFGSVGGTWQVPSPQQATASTTGNSPRRGMEAQEKRGCDGEDGGEGLSRAGSGCLSDGAQAGNLQGNGYDETCELEQLLLGGEPDQAAGPGAGGLLIAGVASGTSAAGAGRDVVPTKGNLALQQPVPPSSLPNGARLASPRTAAIRGGTIGSVTATAAAAAVARTDSQRGGDNSSRGVDGSSRAEPSISQMRGVTDEWKMGLLGALLPEVYFTVAQVGWWLVVVGGSTDFSVTHWHVQLCLHLRSYHLLWFVLQQATEPTLPTHLVVSSKRFQH